MGAVIAAHISVQRATGRGRAHSVHSTESDAKGCPRFSKIWILEIELCRLCSCQ